jgi:hypothetical protein
VEHESYTRRTALWLLVLLAPLLVVGALTTVSVLGAVFGVPLLVLTIPPAVVAWRVRSSPSDPKRLRHLAFASALVAGALTLSLATSLAIGYDDRDTLRDFAALAVETGWAAAAWLIAWRARTQTAKTSMHH